MTGTLDRIEALGLSQRDGSGNVWDVLARDVLALVEVAKAAQELAVALREQAPEWMGDEDWPQLPVLCAALARLEDNQ